MVTLNLGSIADRILARVDNVPDNVSGALLDIVDEQRLYMEEYTLLSIGSTAIAEKFQPALIQFSIAETMNQMQLTGADVTSIKLGEFSTKKGGESNLSTSAKAVRADAEEKLKRLGRGVKWKRVLL